MRKPDKAGDISVNGVTVNELLRAMTEQREGRISKMELDRMSYVFQGIMAPEYGTVFSHAEKRIAETKDRIRECVDAEWENYMTPMINQYRDTVRELLVMDLNRAAGSWLYEHCREHGTDPGEKRIEEDKRAFDEYAERIENSVRVMVCSRMLAFVTDMRQNLGLG